MRKDDYLQKAPVEMQDYLRTCSRMKKFPFEKLFANGIPARDFGVLSETAGLIRENEADVSCVRVSAIVRKMHVPAPLVSRNLKSLEKKGLIRRETEAEDRRNTLVYVTETGWEVVRTSNEAMISFMTGVVNEMGNEEMKKLTASMSRFLDCMEHEAARRIK